MTRGDPARLLRYSDTMRSRVAGSRAPAATYGTAVRRLRGAPSDLPIPTADRSADIAEDLDELDRIDRQTALFAAALRVADQLARFPFLGGRPLGSPPAVDPAAARALAADLAEELDAALDEGYLDPELLDRLERAVAVPELAVALIEQLGPEALLALPMQLQRRYDSLTMGTYVDLDRPPHGFLASSEQVIDALGRALALASRNGLRPSFADDLVGQAASVHGSAVGLSLYLTRGGTFGERFATRVAEGLYEAERTAGSSPFWRPLAEDGHGGVPSFFGSDHWFDPLTGASVALSAHPLAAQGFLLAADVGDAGDRLSYLTSQRRWDADQGAGYGQLIEAATTVHRDHGPLGSAGYRSALIASRFLDELPFDEGGRWRLTGRTEPGYRIYDALVPTVGTLLAVYIADLQGVGTRRAGHDHAGTVWTEGYPYLGEDAQAHGIVLDPRRSNLLLAAVARDEAALADLLLAQHLLTREELTLAAGSIHDGVPHHVAEGRVLTALSANSLLAGQLLAAGELVDLSAARAEDARVATLVGLADKGVTLALPGGPLTKAVLGQATSTITGDLGSASAEAVAQQEARVTNVLQHSAMVDLTHAVLYEQGWYDEGGPFVTYQPSDTAPFVSDGNLVPHGELDAVALQRYDLWARDAGTAGFLNQISTSLTEGMATR